MDVSEVTRQQSTGAGSALAAGARVAGAPAPPEAPTRPPAPPAAHQRAVDPSEALAERLHTGLDRPSALAPPPPSEATEVWIPAWVRAQYAARARRGWFMPAPTLLAGYVDHDDDPAP